MKRIRSFPAILLLMGLIGCIQSAAQTTPRYLLRGYEAGLAGSLTPLKDFRPMPRTAEDWRRYIPDSTAVKLVRAGEGELSYVFKQLPVSLYFEFMRTGNRVDYEKASFEKRNVLWRLVLAESVEGKGRFLDKIAEGVWSICEETYWGLPPHLYLQRTGGGLPDVTDPTVDLFTAETAALLAWTDYFVGAGLARLSPLLRDRVYTEVSRRVFVPMATAKYSYLGGGRSDIKLNNWAPWVMSNYCAAALLLEKDMDRRVWEVKQAMDYTDLYLNGLGDDGGCEEGPAYWTAAGASVFDVLDLLSDATKGKVDVFHHPLIRNMGAYIYKMHIAGRYFVDIADASPEVQLDGKMLFRFGKQMGDSVMEGFGSWLMHTDTSSSVFYDQFHRTRFLYDLGVIRSCAAYPPAEPVPGEVWFNDIQLMAARNGKGFFVAAHGGNNGESHNHNDVGDLILYVDGQPVIIDVGSGTYTARTFSPQRYNIWFNSSGWHNLPVINQSEQKDGAVYAARSVHYLGRTLSMDIAGAYPPEAGVKSWVRMISLKADLVVDDKYELSNGMNLEQHFVTVDLVDLSQPGKVKFVHPGGGVVWLDYPADQWSVGVESAQYDIPESAGVKEHWKGKVISRVVFKAKKIGTTGEIRWRFYR